jgi:hypothetical protein
MIDVGDGNGSFKHPLLKDRTEYVGRTLPASEQLHGAHSAEVAGVIAQACPAKIFVYDVGTTAGWDKVLFVNALQAILEMDPRPAVINISVGWEDGWPDADQAIQDCIDNDIAVVVAMGDGGASAKKINWYPATMPGVIAVAGTDTHDLQLLDSDSGDHVWIAAPGEDVVTVVTEEDLGTRNGTSFAAAQVTAAVWLAKRANPEVTPPRMKEALAKTAVSQPVEIGASRLLGEEVASRYWNTEVGWGRIDVSKLIAAVTPPTQTGEVTVADAILPSSSARVRASTGAPREIETEPPLR